MPKTLDMNDKGACDGVEKSILIAPLVGQGRTGSISYEYHCDNGKHYNGHVLPVA